MTLRTLGQGEIAWVESGNFTSTVPADEPVWTDTNLAEWGVYKGTVRDFAVEWLFSDDFEVGTTSGWSATTP